MWSALRLAISTMCVQAMLAIPAAADSLRDSHRCFQFVDQFAKAIPHCNRAIAAGDLDPHNMAITYNNRGEAHRRNGQDLLAIADYDRALSLAPKMVQAYNNRAIAHEQAGRLHKALADYNRALDIDPSYVKALFGRGNTYSALGDAEKAIQDFNRCLELRPDDAGALFNRGIEFERLGRLRLAEQDFRDAYRLLPGNEIFRSKLIYFGAVI